MLCRRHVCWYVCVCAFIFIYYTFIIAFIYLHLHTQIHMYVCVCATLCAAVEHFCASLPFLLLLNMFAPFVVHFVNVIYARV